MLSNQSSASANLPSLDAVRGELKRREWALDPVRYFRERLGLSLWEKQREIAESIRDHRKTHVRSGHLVGKTLTAGGLVLWFLECFTDSKVITTSGNFLDVRVKLWGAIRSLYRKGGQWLGPDILETSLKINDDHYALGLSPKDVEPFQGHNAPHVLVVFDEASAIEDKFFDAAEAQATRMIALGNPILTSGPFYRYARDSEWNHIHIGCEDHPNVIEGQIVIPGGPTREWVQRCKDKWGERSPLYLSRVAGEFPEESTDTWFPLSVIEACFLRFDELRSQQAKAEGKRMGLDVARAGGDHTVAYISEWLEAMRRTRKVLELTKTEHHATRLKIAQIQEREKCEVLNVDAGGEGSGLADETKAMDLPVKRIHFGAESGRDDCFNVRAEMFRQLSEAMVAGMAIERDEELAEELSVIGGMIELKEKGGKAVFALPPKDEVKAQLGRSPDKADALALSIYRKARASLKLL